MKKREIWRTKQAQSRSKTTAVYARHIPRKRSIPNSSIYHRHSLSVVVTRSEITEQANHRIIKKPQVGHSGGPQQASCMMHTAYLVLTCIIPGRLQCNTAAVHTITKSWSKSYRLLEHPSAHENIKKTFKTNDEWLVTRNQRCHTSKLEVYPIPLCPEI